MSILTDTVEKGRVRESGMLLAGVVKRARDLVRVGTTTADIDREIEAAIVDAGGRPAFKGYRGFPAASCISINNEVVHGIPGPRPIHQGDVVSIDIGMEREGLYTDTAFTCIAGKGSREACKLLRVCEEALYAGIRAAVAGNHVGDISHAIQETIERHGFSVVRDFVGHGLGRSLHEEPQIPNFGNRGEGSLLNEGMLLAIEPMANQKGFRVRIQDDGWTVVTEDGGLSAHFEHTVLVGNGKPEILTQYTRGDGTN